MWHLADMENATRVKLEITNGTNHLSVDREQREEKTTPGLFPIIVSHRTVLATFSVAMLIIGTMTKIVIFKVVKKEGLTKNAAAY